MFRIKIATFLGALAIMLSAYAVPAMSFGQFGFGVSGMGAHIEGSATETLKEDSTQASASKIINTFIPSGFIQFKFDEPWDFVIGTEHIPGTTELAARTQTRTHLTSAAGATTSVTQTAQAEISDHINVYLESPAFGPLYVKAARGQVSVKTNESLGTGSVYGDQNVNYTTYGIGLRHHLTEIAVD